jgi:hypothetical protein
METVQFLCSASWQIYFETYSIYESPHVHMCAGCANKHDALLKLRSEDTTQPKFLSFLTSANYVVLYPNKCMYNFLMFLYNSLVHATFLPEADPEGEHQGVNV